MTSADDDACSNALSSSGSKRTYSSSAFHPLTVFSWDKAVVRHSRIWIRVPYRAWSRWNATPMDLVAGKS
jgi:hypothetical protein